MSPTTKITFEAILENDNIKIPADYLDRFAALFKNKKVRITVQSTEESSKSSPEMDDWRKTHSSFIQYLIDNPIDIAHPVRLTKEELHDR